MKLFEPDKQELKLAKDSKTKQAEMICDRCNQKSELLYFPTSWGSICSSCYLLRLAKEE
jgi:hypothetical protein